VAGTRPHEVVAVTGPFLDLEPESYRPHRLHASDRTWTETNCYVDLWIEVLHSLGLDPVAAAAFTLSTDFEGDQWTFSKFPPEDLRSLWGLEVAEMNVWRPVIDHIEEQLSFGRLVTVEVDSWFLPDTAGVSYRHQHAKTTIVPADVDRVGRRLRYFHGAGYYELAVEDFDGLFPRDHPAGGGTLPLPPYMETVRLDRLHAEDDRLVARVVDLARAHLVRRAVTSPILRLRKRIEDDLDWLAREGLDTFHLYAFGTCRQCGAAAELAGDFVDWLDRHDAPGLAGAAEQFRRVAAGAKALQFGLARAASGRKADIATPLAEMDECWQSAITTLARRYDR
jgi:hypothetical protein